MKDKTKIKGLSSKKRQKRIRKRIKGTQEKPRLTVYKSLRHIYAQLVDDLAQRTLLGVSSLTPALRKEINEKSKKTEIAKRVGLFLAYRAKEKGVERVVYDRNRYIYHGRVKALAEGAREGGLKF